MDQFGRAKIVEMWMWLRQNDAERRVQSLNSLQLSDRKTMTELGDMKDQNLLGDTSGNPSSASASSACLTIFNTVGSTLGYVLSIVLLAVFTVKPEELQTLCALGIIGAVWMALANGANDIANAMGTSVGSGALTVRLLY